MTKADVHQFFGAQQRKRQPRFFRLVARVDY